ncbi:MAG TPA: hypothetical protein VGG20_03155 [Thermoanaerobaculia bacterium]|jgi:hypothetical protein
MSDRLLRDLGDLARSEAEAEEARFDNRWDRLAAGTLTAEEEAELKALAESSPEAHEMYEAFRPLGADFQARVVSAIQAEQARDTPPPLPPPLPDPLPPVLPFFPRAVRRVEVWLGTAAAVAAGVFFTIQMMAPLQPLPGYELAIAVQSEYRGAAPQTAAPGSPITLTVRPDTVVKGAVETQDFLSCAPGDLRPWQLKSSSNHGVLTLKGTLDRGTPTGSCEIWIVVFRPGKAPSDFPAEWREGRRAGNADWRAVHAQLDVRVPP